MEKCWTVPEAVAKDPVSDFVIDVCSARPDTAPHEMPSDLSNDMRLRRLEVEENEVVKVFPIALA